MTSEQQDPGDSGSPTYNGNTAYGIHQGEATVDGARRDMKSQAGNMPFNIGAWVATS